MIDINKLELDLTKEFKKRKFEHFLKVYITKCKYNNNYLIYIKNKYPYNGEDIYVGYINIINNTFKIKKIYINILSKYLF